MPEWSERCGYQTRWRVGSRAVPLFAAHLKSQREMYGKACQISLKTVSKWIELRSRLTMWRQHCDPLCQRTQILGLCTPFEETVSRRTPIIADTDRHVSRHILVITCACSRSNRKNGHRLRPKLILYYKQFFAMRRLDRMIGLENAYT